MRRDATASVPVVWKDVLTDEMVGEYEHVLLFDPAALAVHPGPRHPKPKSLKY